MSSETLYLQKMYYPTKGYGIEAHLLRQVHVVFFRRITLAKLGVKNRVQG